MMISGLTLGTYFGWRFLKSVAGIFLLCAGILFIVDAIELVRRFGESSDVSLLRLMTIALMRLPSLSEQLLPFAVLFGSIVSLLAMSRKLELVIARSVGVSVWQFLMPALITTLILGALAVTVYNPLAASLKERSETMLSKLDSGANLETVSSQWMRQDGPDGPSVVRASGALEQGRILNDVTFFLYDRNDMLQERVDAETAELRPGRWDLMNAIVTRQDGEPRSFARYSVSTYLNEIQVRENFAVADAVPFWDLPDYIDLADKAGLAAQRYKLQYQALLARPLLLCAMVLIAATVSLRVFRYGGIGRLVVGGIFAGFVLYVITEIAEDLGGAGLIPTVLAAWGPAAFATLLGLTALLYLEDG
jgi:lipopolysaccharide export system permease protein